MPSIRLYFRVPTYIMCMSGKMHNMLTHILGVRVKITIRILFIHYYLETVATAKLLSIL